MKDSSHQSKTTKVKTNWNSYALVIWGLPPASVSSLATHWGPITSCCAALKHPLLKDEDICPTSLSNGLLLSHVLPKIPALQNWRMTSLISHLPTIFLYMARIVHGTLLWYPRSRIKADQVFILEECTCVFVCVCIQWTSPDLPRLQ